MIELGPATCDEMVLCFLKAEIDSTRRQDYMAVLDARGLDRASLIDNPDFTDWRANSERGAVLDSVRGYRRRIALFTEFPRDVTWRRVSVAPAEFGRLKYLNDNPPWITLTGGTRLVNDGARNLSKCPSVYAPVKAIASDIESATTIEALIMVDDNNGGLVFLEGNKRATAFVLHATKPISAFVGSSPAMAQWRFI